ncbi:MAG TPA: hypothetical protein VIM16_06120 [Mucilaginibacter sp.]|jgi:hypothetical protein
MKSRLKLTFVLLAGVALFYMACKKDSTNASQGPMTSADVISRQIASNLSKSLSGFYGGIKIGDGIKTPSIITSANAAPNPICGFTVDSVLNYTTNIGDTIKSQSNGRIIFYFNCTNGQPDGYRANDSLKTTGTAPGYSFFYNITQYYVISSLNPGITLLSVNGSLKSFVGLTYNKAGVKPTADSTSYALTGLTIDLSKQDDITSGLATFVTSGSNNFGPWNYTGTIKYLGNHMADVTINGKVYHVTI